VRQVERAADQPSVKIQVFPMTHHIELIGLLAPA
jgi:hypothetical protein